MKIAVVGKLISNAVKKYFINIRRRKAFIKKQINLSNKKSLVALGHTIAYELKKSLDLETVKELQKYDFLRVKFHTDPKYFTEYFSFYFARPCEPSCKLACYFLLEEEGKFLFLSRLTKKELRGVIDFKYVKREPMPKDPFYSSCVSFSDNGAYKEIKKIILRSYDKYRNRYTII